jgi:hypothetical protein
MTSLNPVFTVADQVGGFLISGVQVRLPETGRMRPLGKGNVQCLERSFELC